MIVAERMAALCLPMALASYRAIFSAYASMLREPKPALSVGQALPHFALLLSLALLCLLLIGAAVLLVTVLQTGAAAVRLRPQDGAAALQPRVAERILDAGVEFATVLCALTVAFCVSLSAVRAVDFQVHDAQDFVRIFAALGHVVLRAGTTFIAFGLLGFVYQRIVYRKRMMMTPLEVKEEAKRSERNPLVRSRMAQLSRGHTEQEAVVAVRGTRELVLLSYDGEIPRVLSRGGGSIIPKLVEGCQRRGIPVVADDALAQALLKVPLGFPLPRALFGPVAQLLVTVGAKQVS